MEQIVKVVSANIVDCDTGDILYSSSKTCIFSHDIKNRVKADDLSAQVSRIVYSYLRGISLGRSLCLEINALSPKHTVVQTELF